MLNEEIKLIDFDKLTQYNDKLRAYIVDSLSKKADKSEIDSVTGLLTNISQSINTINTKLANKIDTWKCTDNSNVIGNIYYAVKGGTYGYKSISVEVVSNTIPIRDNAGRFKVPRPSDNLDVANKQYVDDAYADVGIIKDTLSSVQQSLNDKVDKISTKGSERVYGITSTGLQTVRGLVTSDSELSIGQIPTYVNGNDTGAYMPSGQSHSVLITGYPTQDYHAVPKRYLDNIINSLSLNTGRLYTHNITIYEGNITIRMSFNIPTSTRITSVEALVTNVYVPWTCAAYVQNDSVGFSGTFSKQSQGVQYADGSVIHELSDDARWDDNITPLFQGDE